VTAAERDPAAGLVGVVEVRRTPEEWCARLGWRILDPDGWRGRQGRPWADPISRDEFERRAAESTGEHGFAAAERDPSDDLRGALIAAGWKPEELTTIDAYSAADVPDLLARVAALEAECAALADVAAKLTHDYIAPGPEWAGGPTCRREVGAFLSCSELAAHPVHRTPAVVRAELEAGP
jgi:hypothetical protein